MQLITSSKQTGLTLIEALFAVAIVAVLAGFASSSFSASISASRTQNGYASLLASLTRAAGDAVRTETDVVMCPSVDGKYCSAGDHWEKGWIIFQALRSGSDRVDSEPILLRQTALPPKVQLATSSGRTRIRFQPNGGNAGSNATFTFCDARGPGKATAYAMSNTGNLRAVPTESGYVTDACTGL